MSRTYPWRQATEDGRQGGGEEEKGGELDRFILLDSSFDWARATSLTVLVEACLIMEPTPSDPKP